MESGILPLLKDACGEQWLAEMQANKRSAVVAPKVNLRECASHMPLLSANKAAYFGSETQNRCHQKSKTGYKLPHKRTFVQPKMHQGLAPIPNVKGIKMLNNAYH